MNRTGDGLLGDWVADKIRIITEGETHDEHTHISKQLISHVPQLLEVVWIIAFDHEDTQCTILYRASSTTYLVSQRVWLWSVSRTHKRPSSWFYRRCRNSPLSAISRIGVADEYEFQVEAIVNGYARPATYRTLLLNALAEKELR